MQIYKYFLIAGNKSLKIQKHLNINLEIAIYVLNYLINTMYSIPVLFDKHNT